ncbi:hypothetical protein Poli38472_006246 [Pythium oligandrum]|uniref:Ricin B lectin domain-containing protein n=1 Tax=Pythium oligandrum TaxID=41045 RepID=A0A8K1CTQ7_PYTOL|nr:hypothetical protein Poli38472_006246 [Pythium oligandrum]|eukprot:TMW68778.1 hypothetical protein Poli38472_006246 [Pythium oligandrum]
MIAEPKYSFEQNGKINDGPEILIKNGKVFMSYSANGCWTNDYKLGLLWMNEEDDPMNAASWQKVDHAVFVGNGAVQAYNPGHNSFFKSPDGKEDWLAYHAAATGHEKCGINRFFNAKLITYNEDGFPNFGGPVSSGHLLPGPSGEPDLPTGDVLKNGVYKSGLKVQQWSALDNNCQKFIFHNVGDNYYTISAVSGGMLLTTKDCKKDPTTGVWFFKPTGQDCQKWRIVSHGDDEYSFISKSANLAFDLRAGNNANGADFNVWNTTYEWTQKFHLTKV